MHTKVSHGDYQTPRVLANEVVHLVAQRLRFPPSFVVEPTCGEGSFLLEAGRSFPRANAIGFELDAAKVQRLMSDATRPLNVAAAVADFFEVDWAAQLAGDRCLVVGNPPWVTVSRLGELSSSNRPQLALNLGHSGLDNKTGASNFDIAEFMTLVLAKCLAHKRDGAIALLLKSTTVRRLAVHLQALASTDVHFFQIDGRRHFGVSVACGLMYVDFTVSTDEPRYLEYESLPSETPYRALIVRGRHLVAEGQPSVRCVAGQQFRSGVKHDAAEVLELSGDLQDLRNKRGENVHLPADGLFPLMKSAGLGKPVSKWLVMPPAGLARYADAAPIATEPILAYLRNNREVFDRRKSSVYAKLGEFSVFGVGSYSFKPWKVAISAFSKSPQFHLVGPWEGKPVLFDDTVYFISFDTEGAAVRAFNDLRKPAAQGALQSRMFPDDMRAVKAKVLNELFCH